MRKTIFIAGAGGYLGSKMTEYFLQKGHKIIALDRFYFGDTLSTYRTNKNVTIIKDDIRYVDKKTLKNVDVVINLASISNDPSSELNPAITQLINHDGAVLLAKIAKEMKVKKYLFASSCSVYGMGQDIVSETSETAPLSEYAKSKLNAENDLLKIADEKFCVTILRMATLYGLSIHRMRFDLIINIMTLHAWKNKKIHIMGGGKQWRPLLHLDDCIWAFSLLVETRTTKNINKEIFNVGSNTDNYQVFQVANFFKKHFPDLVIESTPDDPDRRSYQVKFDKIKKILNFTTTKTIDDGIREIKEALEKGEITDDIRTNTSWYYRHLIEADKILSSVKRNNILF